MQRVLLTGAAGGIGSGLRKLLKPLYKELRLSDLAKPADLRSDEPFIAADLSRIEEVATVVARPEKPQRKTPIFTSRFCFFASFSVSPHQATSGSV